jgi:hypothetical protein
MRRMSNHGRHATADVGRPDLLPSGTCGYGRGRPRPSALSGEVLGGSFAIGPRRSRLEPDATALVGGESSARHELSLPGD